MKVLVLNGSAYREKSATLMLTRRFLAGMGEEAEYVHAADLKANPCLACYACWFKTKGVCVQQDEASLVLAKMRSADIIILSTPLYAYGMPSPLKALIDRTLSFNQPEMYIGDDGRTHHYGYEGGKKRVVLISTAGFPDVKGNFDGLIFQVRRMYGEKTETICCAEASLLTQEETASLAEGYLSTVETAGAEYKANGMISAETHRVLDVAMIPREIFIENTNRVFASMS